MNQDKPKTIHAIVQDDIPEYDTTAEDDIMEIIREECENAADTLFVESLGDLYQGKIGPGEVFWLGEPKYVGKIPPSELVPCRPPKKKTIHAIAHFDFDGSCRNCKCVDWFYDNCQLSKTNFSVRGVSDGERHEHCPLCIEEDENEPR